MEQDTGEYADANYFNYAALHKTTGTFCIA